MRLSEHLRSEADHKLLVGDKFEHTRAMLIQAADLLDIYYMQCKSAIASKRLGQCKCSVWPALKEDI